MKIAVIGGSGLIGSKIFSLLWRPLPGGSTQLLID